MSVDRKASVRDINRHIRKYNLISLPATIILGLGLYALITGEGGNWHPLFADQGFLIKVMVAAGIIELLAMARVTKLNRLKHVIQRV